MVQFSSWGCAIASSRTQLRVIYPPSMRVLGNTSGDFLTTPVFPSIRSIRPMCMALHGILGKPLTFQAILQRKRFGFNHLPDLPSKFYSPHSLLFCHAPNLTRKQQIFRLSKISCMTRV